MKELEIDEIAREYVILNGETIYFDEPFDEVPVEEDFKQWLQNIKKVLENINNGKT